MINVIKAAFRRGHRPKFAPLVLCRYFLLILHTDRISQMVSLNMTNAISSSWLRLSSTKGPKGQEFERVEKSARLNESVRQHIYRVQRRFGWLGLIYRQKITIQLRE